MITAGVVVLTAATPTHYWLRLTGCSAQTKDQPWRCAAVTTRAAVRCCVDDPCFDSPACTSICSSERMHKNTMSSAPLTVAAQAGAGAKGSLSVTVGEAAAECAAHGRRALHAVLALRAPPGGPAALLGRLGYHLRDGERRGRRRLPRHLGPSTGDGAAGRDGAADGDAPAQRASGGRPALATPAASACPCLSGRPCRSRRCRCAGGSVAGGRELRERARAGRLAPPLRGSSSC